MTGPSCGRTELPSWGISRAASGGKRCLHRAAAEEKTEGSLGKARAPGMSKRWEKVSLHKSTRLHEHMCLHKRVPLPEDTARLRQTLLCRRDMVREQPVLALPFATVVRHSVRVLRHSVRVLRSLPVLCPGEIWSANPRCARGLNPLCIPANPSSL